MQMDAELIAEKLCAKLGVLAGEGDFGSVWFLNDTEKVIKVTSDPDEVMCAILQQDFAGASGAAAIRHFPTIHGIYKLDSLLYAIVMDRVHTIEDSLTPFINEIDDWLEHYDVEDLRGYFDLMDNQVNAEDLKRLSPDAQQLITDLSCARQEAVNMGFRANDAHWGNIGILEGRYVLFDQRISNNDLHAYRITEREFVKRNARDKKAFERVVLDMNGHDGMCNESIEKIALSLALAQKAYQDTSVIQPISVSFAEQQFFMSPKQARPEAISIKAAWISVFNETWDDAGSDAEARWEDAYDQFIDAMQPHHMWIETDIHTFEVSEYPSYSDFKGAVIDYIASIMPDAIHTLDDTIEYFTTALQSNLNHAPVLSPVYPTFESTPLLN